MGIVGYFDNRNRSRIIIEVEHNEIKEKIEALLDSGADYSLLPKYVGIQLGIKSPNKPDGYSTGIGGKVPIKRINLLVRIGKEKLMLKFAWLYTCNDIPVVVGRKGIFDRFNIEFRPKEGRIIFKRA